MVDGIVILRWFLGPLRDVLGGAGHDVAYVVLRAPLDICVARVREREGPASADPAVLKQIWSQFADLGPYEHHALDVEDHAPVEVAEAIDRLLEEGSHLL